MNMRYAVDKLNIASPTHHYRKASHSMSSLEDILDPHRWKLKAEYGGAGEAAIIERSGYFEYIRKRHGRYESQLSVSSNN